MARWLFSIAVAGHRRWSEFRAEITSQYVSANLRRLRRALNADTSLTGATASGWRIETGSFDSVIDGLGIVAVLSASETLARQNHTAKSIVIVDEKATPTQRSPHQMAKTSGAVSRQRHAVARPDRLSIALKKTPRVVQTGDMQIETLDKTTIAVAATIWFRRSARASYEPAMAVESSLAGIQETGAMPNAEAPTSARSQFADRGFFGRPTRERGKTNCLARASACHWKWRPSR